MTRSATARKRAEACKPPHTNIIIVRPALCELPSLEWGNGRQEALLGDQICALISSRGCRAGMTKVNTVRSETEVADNVPRCASARRGTLGRRHASRREGGEAGLHGPLERTPSESSHYRRSLPRFSAVLNSMITRRISRSLRTLIGSSSIASRTAFLIQRLIRGCRSTNAA